MVDDDGFEVGLSFGGVPERLGVPFEAVTAFYDPAVQFGFQFETIDAERGRKAGRLGKSCRETGKPPSAPEPSKTEAPAQSARSPAPAVRPDTVAAAKWCGSTGSGRNERLSAVGMAGLLRGRSLARQLGFSASPHEITATVR